MKPNSDNSTKALFSLSMSQNTTIKTLRTTVLPITLHGCETWSFTLRKAHKQTMFVNRVLRKIFWPNRKKKQETGENYITSNIMICIPYQMFG
jgi:hypothetical protein